MMEGNIILFYNQAASQLIKLFRIRVFSMKSMKPLAILSYHRDSVYSLDFSKSDNLLVASSQDNRISLWNIY